MKKSILAMAFAFVTIWVLLAADITAGWLTERLRVFGVVMLPTAMVASLLILYFDWRRELRRRLLAERDDHRHRQKAA